MLHILSVSGLNFRLVQSPAGALLFAANTAERKVLAVTNCVEKADPAEGFHSNEEDLVVPQCLVGDVFIYIPIKGFVCISRK